MYNFAYTNNHTNAWFRNSLNDVVCTLILTISSELFPPHALFLPNWNALTNISIPPFETAHSLMLWSWPLSRLHNSLVCALFFSFSWYHWDWWHGPLFLWEELAVEDTSCWKGKIEFWSFWILEKGTRQQRLPYPRSWPITTHVECLSALPFPGPTSMEGVHILYLHMYACLYMEGISPRHSARQRKYDSDPNFRAHVSISLLHPQHATHATLFCLHHFLRFQTRRTY